MDPLLVVEDLQVTFNTEQGPVAAVDGVSFHVNRGETLGIVGESGCGKSVTSLSVMRLISFPPGRITQGRVMFEGRDLLGLNEPEMRKIRGNDISMIFQEPMTSLNPVYPVGAQISEVLRLHQGLGKAAAGAQAVEMLRLVGISLPERRVREYPHELSGGMRQRVMIAMALACQPRLLIADEPTTALDVTIQAQILDLIESLRDRFGMAVILITHDLGVIAEMAERVVVMYAGAIVEEAPVGLMFREPLHPYTEGLLSSLPRLDQGRKRLKAIEGLVPDPGHLPPGCRFQPRCPYAEGACLTHSPKLAPAGEGRLVACWRCPTASGQGVA